MDDMTLGELYAKKKQLEDEAGHLQIREVAARFNGHQDEAREYHKELTAKLREGGDVLARIFALSADALKEQE